MTGSPTSRARRLTACALVAALTVPACVVKQRTVTSVQPADGVRVLSAVKVHLLDGSVVVFRRGVVFTATTLTGEGTRFDLRLQDPRAVTSVPLADVGAVEAFRESTDVASSAVLSLATAAASYVGAGALYVAIFGSCPTVYSTGAEGPHLEAETFSTSVSPLLEGRDLDRLEARADAQGRIRLEVRNEALETHSINHLQLLEVRHAAGETVVPDPDGRPLVVGPGFPVHARDRQGRDLTAVLAAADGTATAADHDGLVQAAAGQLEDWIEITAPAPPGPQAALRLRLRNSLLDTVLFYDVMLARAGPQALDWLSRSMEEIGPSVELGRWRYARLGLRVEVWGHGAWRPVGRLPDAGPIAWHDTAIAVPVPAGEPVLRLRLLSASDAWRIDQAQVAPLGAPTRPRSVAVARATTGSAAGDADALSALRAPDARYVRTVPGQRFDVEFDVGAEPPSGARTFLLSSQGFYVEWIRGSWLRDHPRPQPFRPNDEALLHALRRWQVVRADMERDFESHKVPVR